MTIAERADQFERATARIGLRNSGQRGIVSSCLEGDGETVSFHSRAADLRLLGAAEIQVIGRVLRGVVRAPPGGHGVLAGMAEDRDDLG